MISATAIDMEELKITGIVVGGEDIGESDRLVRILTPDGILSARMRGVKKEKAKLKFAAMPFSFCEYVLLKRGSFYSVKTASQCESLFGVTSLPEKYITGSVMLETAAAAAGGSDGADVFFDLLSALKMLIYSSVHPYSLGLNFVYRLLVRGGYIAPGSRDTEYNVDISAQQSLPADRAKRLLKAYLSLFENKYCGRIKSAKLLV